MYHLNTERQDAGISLIDPDTTKQVFYLRYVSDYKKRLPWRLETNVGVEVARFRSLEAAEYRALSEHIEQRAFADAD